MAEPVKFVRVRICVNCGEWLEPGTKENLCPKCKAEREEKDNETPDIL